MTARRCIVCAGEASSPVSAGVSRCEICGLLSADEIPSQEEVEDLYGPAYFFGAEYVNYEADRAALERNFSRRLRNLVFELRASDRVVEIGSAYGYFLNLLRDRVAWHKGYDVSAAGVESSRRMGLNASTVDFLGDPLEAGSIDAVFMWDVIEHLARPDAVVAKVAEVLRPGGHVVLTTGDAGALVARARGSRWRMLHPPTHLHYFDPRTLTVLLAANGLVVRRIRHPGIYRNLGSVAGQLARGWRERRWAPFAAGAERLHHSRLAGLDVPLNLGDIMEITAVKWPATGDTP